MDGQTFIPLILFLLQIVFQLPQKFDCLELSSIKFTSAYIRLDILIFCTAEFERIFNQCQPSSWSR